MSAFENAKKFFEACEAPEGWTGCKPYVADGAVFEAQCEPLAEIETVEEYCNWMYSIATTALPGAAYVLHASSWDAENRIATFFATINLKHTGDGGPVPPTNKETNADYVYCLKMDSTDRVEKMFKVWNSGWSLRELGWA